MASKVFNISGGGGTSGGGGGIALGGISNLQTIEASGAVYFKWTDPSDITVAGSTLATWKGTLLVRKAGSFPVNRRDGEVVGDFTTRNSHQNTWFGDSGLTNGETYYYKFFPYTTTSVYTDDPSGQVALTPGAVPVGPITGLTTAATGNGKVELTWTDPDATVTEDGIVKATWAKTVVVFKAGGAPSGPDDASAAYRQEVTTRNLHVTNPLVVTGLTNGTSYAVAVYTVTTDGAVSAAVTKTVTPNRIVVATVPSQDGTLTYNGAAQEPVLKNFDAAKMTKTVTAQTNAGTYSTTTNAVKITLKDDYCWSDGSTSVKYVPWTIDKAAGSLSLSPSSTSLIPEAMTRTINVTRPGNGKVVASSSNTNIATVTVNDPNGANPTLTIASVNKNSGNVTISVTVEEGANYTAVTTAQTVAVVAEFLPVGPVTNLTAVAAGNGKANLTWTDPAATLVEDGVTKATWAKTVVILKSGSAPTGPDDAGDYRLEVTTRNQYSNTPLTVTGLTNGTTYNVAVYTITTGGIASSAVTKTVVPNRLVVATVPTQSGTLTYNGNAQEPALANFDSSKMTKSVTAQTNAGTYSGSTTGVKITLNDDYCWTGGDTSPEYVSWTINKAAGSLSVSPTSITLNPSTLNGTVNVTRPGNGTVVASSNDTSVATVTVNDKNGANPTLTINSVGNKSGNVTITVTVKAGDNYTAVTTGKTVSVVAEFLPASGKALNEYTWAQIRQVSDAGLASTYWKVGDRHSLVLNGTVGTKSYSNVTVYVHILGFDHNSTREGAKKIHFGGYHTALSGGTNIALCDFTGQNWYYKTDGTKAFNMNHWGNYNYGGWAGCDLRYDILGSTKTAPSGYGAAVTTARVGYDAPADTATNPVANTLMAAYPADLRAVMKPITKYTDSKGNNSNVAANVTATVDYLPLLAEFEIFGTRNYANQYEKDYQAQYAYYSAGNSKVLYNQQTTSSAVIYWERSANYYNATSFCCVTTSGNADASHAAYSLGLSPLFAV